MDIREEVRHPDLGSSTPTPEEQSKTGHPFFWLVSCL